MSKTRTTITLTSDDFANAHASANDVGYAHPMTSIRFPGSSGIESKGMSQAEFADWLETLARMVRAARYERNPLLDPVRPASEDDVTRALVGCEGSELPADDGGSTWIGF